MAVRRRSQYISSVADVVEIDQHEATVSYLKIANVFFVLWPLE